MSSQDQAGVGGVQMDSDRRLPLLKNATSVTRQEGQKDVNVDYKTGAKFIGKIHDYKKIGKGIFIWPSGAKYEGEYCDNLRQGKGVQYWPDGSSYEGDFDADLRHGKGHIKWANGETYEGEFFKDCRHGRGTYSWPDGSSYTGKFYMNRKEGYGTFTFANKNVFEGLYKNDERLGPGVLTYPDGSQDVGLWAGEKLIKLCTTVDGAFTMKDHPEFEFDPKEHVTYINMVEVNNRIAPISDIIKPPSIFDYMPESRVLERVNEFFSEDLDPRSLAVNREAFDRQFFREQEAEGQGGEKDQKEEKTSCIAWNKTPMMIEMQRHVHKHRRGAKEVTFSVEQVCSGDRTGFATKGRLEQASERLLKASGEGELQAVEDLLNRGLVDPDVTDRNGHTALIGATVHWHTDIINVLLNHGADVNHLNDEGSSALSAGTIFYYPIDCFRPNIAERQLVMDKDGELVKKDGKQRGSVTVKAKLSEKRVSHINQLNRVRSQQEVTGTADDNEEAPNQDPSTEGQKPEDDSTVCENDNINAATMDTEEFESNATMLNYQIQVPETLVERCATQLSTNERVVSAASQGAQINGTARLLAMEINRHEQMKSTLDLLLQRGADPNASDVPMPVLFFAIKAADVDMVKTLLMKGASTSTRLPKEKGSLVPLHIAAAIPGEEGALITELLLDALADPDARAEEDDSFLDDTLMEEWSKDPVSEEQLSLLGGRTPLHIACARDDNYRHACKVVHLLLAHRANTNLLCNGFSPLGLAIASGNDLAVDELLAFGADPSLPLTHGVGNALCVASSTKYEERRTIQARLSLIDKLIKAGGDILAPVAVNPKRQIGTAVDYAYYMYNLDRRIAHMPYHALTISERETYNARRKLLAHLGDILRTKAVQREKMRLEEEARAGRRSASPSQGFLYTGAGASVAQAKLARSSQVTFEAKADRSRKSQQDESVSSRSDTNGSVANVFAMDSEELNRLLSKRCKPVVRKPLFKYCYECGRSVGVRLSVCTRCKEVYYCSKACKMKAWNARHKEECVRLSGKPSKHEDDELDFLSRDHSGKSPSPHRRGDSPTPATDATKGKKDGDKKILVQGDGQSLGGSKSGSDRNLSKTSSDQNLSKTGSEGRNPMKPGAYRNASKPGPDGSLARKGSAKTGSDRSLAKSLPGRKGSAGPKRGSNPHSSSQRMGDGGTTRASGSKVPVHGRSRSAGEKGKGRDGSPGNQKPGSSPTRRPVLIDSVPKWQENLPDNCFIDNYSNN